MDDVTVTMSRICLHRQRIKRSRSAGKGLQLATGLLPNQSLLVGPVSMSYRHNAQNNGHKKMDLFSKAKMYPEVDRGGNTKININLSQARFIWEINPCLNIMGWHWSTTNHIVLYDWREWLCARVYLLRPRLRRTDRFLSSLKAY